MDIVYAVGDIHGCLPLLQLLIDKIGNDAKQHAVEHAEIVFVGDYIDRGPNSAGVIDFLERDQFLPHWKKIYLMGNHEDLCLTAMHKPRWGMQEIWLMSGGCATVASYGIDPHVMPPEVVVDNLSRIIPTPHVEWLERLKLYHVSNDHLFVHAGVDPTRSLEQQKRDDLLWIRFPFLIAETYDVPHRVVHGHTPMPAVVVRDHRISIDTGACETGILSAVALHGTSVRIIEASEEDLTPS